MAKSWQTGKPKQLTVLSLSLLGLKQVDEFLRTVIKDSKDRVLSFWVLLDRPTPLWPGIQAILSAGKSPSNAWERRVANRKGVGGGGFSGPKKYKPNTGSTAPNHAVYRLHLHITFLGQCRKQSGTGICRPSSMPACSVTRLGCQTRKCRCPPFLYGGMAVPNVNGKVWDRLVGLVHCKDTIPKILNKYSQKRNCAASVPISTFMCLWAFCKWPWSICLFCCRKISGTILGIYKSLTDTWIWKLGLKLRNSFPKKTWMEFSLQCRVWNFMADSNLTRRCLKCWQYF